MRISRRAIGILALSAIIQVVLCSLPDTMGDLLEYRIWARTLAEHGLAVAYWPKSAFLTSPEVREFLTSQEMLAPIDYPPLVPYLLWAIGRGLGAVSHDALLHNDRLLDVLIRLPFCITILLIAFVVHLEARRVALQKADLICALVALNPALIFDTAYWGQSDAACAFLIVLAVVLLVHCRPEWSWVVLACAALVKPLAYPFVPLIMLETWKRFGLRRLFSSAIAGAFVAAVVFVPFGWIGRLGPGLHALISQMGEMSYTSVDGHNLWWIIGRGLPWTNANAHRFGVSWKVLSLILFGTFLLITLVRLWRSKQPRALYVSAASTAFGFFVLATHMHENHLFITLPLLALLAADLQWARTVMIALTVTLLANMLLHDPFLDNITRPYIPGPHVRLPAIEEGAQEASSEVYRSLGYPWIADEASGEISLAGYAATLVNAQANVVFFVLWLIFAYSGGSFDNAIAGRDWRPPLRRIGPAIALFVLATSIYFLANVLHRAT